MLFSIMDTKYGVNIVESNDIHSFQKEHVCPETYPSYFTLNWHWQHQNDEQPENLIPVLMANTGLGVKQTMQLSYHICRLEVEGFCANADRLCVGEDAQGRRIREVFINCCTDMFMGLIHWRYYRPLAKYRDSADLYLVMLASAGSSKRTSILIILLHSRLDLLGGPLLKNSWEWCGWTADMKSPLLKRWLSTESCHCQVRVICPEKGSSKHQFDI